MPNIPSSNINFSEGFNFETPAGSSGGPVDLSDNTINNNITQFLSNTVPGRSVPYINGSIGYDNPGYFLTSDPSKTGQLTFNDYGKGGVTLPLSGAETIDGHANPFQVDWSGHLISGPDTPINNRTAERHAIKQSFIDSGHNSYAYKPHLHVDFNGELDIGTNANPIADLNEGTGIYTSRVIDMPFKFFAGNQTHGYTDPTAASPINLPSGEIDYLATAKHMYGISHSGYRPIHKHAASLMVRLTGELEDGEYIPICMLDFIDLGAGDYRVDSMDPSISTPNFGVNALYPQSTTWPKYISPRDTFERHLPGTTGAPSDEWTKYLLQYHLLTTNHLSSYFYGGSRQVRDMIVFLGKPDSGNTKGGNYELIIWYSGKTDSRWRGNGRLSTNVDPEGNHSGGPDEHLEHGNRPVVVNIPIDHNGPGGDVFEPNTWIPLFIDTSTHHNSRLMPGTYKTGTSAPWVFYIKSTGGTTTGGFAGGIQGFYPNNTNNADLHNHRGGATYPGHTVNGGRRYFHGGGDLAYWTFLATEKIQLTNINYHSIANTYCASPYPEHDSYQPPSNPKHPAYYPVPSQMYETIGTGSELVDTQSSWTDKELLIDGDAAQQSTLTRIGEDGAILVKFKDADPGQSIDDDDTVKDIAIDIRGISKIYINPGLIIKIGLYDYTDSANPVGLTDITELLLSDSLPIDTQITLSSKPDGTPLKYSDLNECYLKI
jgi:hypothetical protein